MTPPTRRRIGGAAILSMAIAAAALAAPLELDAVLGRPAVSGLVAAEAVPRIAWVQNSRGVRSVWTAAAPAYTPLRLVESGSDDGQPIGALQLTPDGSVLVYVRGSAKNAAGELANPGSDPAGVERAIWAVETAGGEPWRIASAGGPVLSPDGASLLYAVGGSVFEVSVRPAAGAAAAETAVPAPLFQARGGLGSLTPSPGGSRIAFVSDRGDHSFVGIFHRDPAKIVWLAPSVDRDTSPVWSPDGREIAFLRAPGMLIGELFDLTGGHEFSIWVGDPASGRARRLWASPDDGGGYAQFYPPSSLAWAAGGRLVFTSEHAAWLHAFALEIASGEVTDLSPGSFEIEAFTLSADRSEVLFWGNHGDVDRRHVWRVRVTGGEPIALTSGAGIEVQPVALADGETVALRFADARSPMAIGTVPLRGGSLRRIAPELPADFPGDQLVTPEQVVFEAADGTRVHGQLFLPADPAARRQLPGVLFMHGGPVRQMLLGWHYIGYYANAYAFNQYLASHGYAVLSVNFRSGIGYGAAFRRAAGQGPRGASEYQDIVAAGRYLQRRAEVDAERIGLWGGSYGGLLTAMGLARDSELFAAGVDLHGVHDWAFRGSDFPLPGGAWGLTEADAELALASSPVADVDRWTSPVLFIHGDDDRNVMFIQTTDLAQRLRRRGTHVETLVFPDEVHGFLRYESWLRTFEAAHDFFERRLAGRSAGSAD